MTPRDEIEREAFEKWWEGDDPMEFAFPTQSAKSHALAAWLARSALSRPAPATYAPRWLVGCGECDGGNTGFVKDGVRKHYRFDGGTYECPRVPAPATEAKCPRCGSDARSVFLAVGGPLPCDDNWHYSECPRCGSRDPAYVPLTPEGPKCFPQDHDGWHDPTPRAGASEGERSSFGAAVLDALMRCPGVVELEMAPYFYMKPLADVLAVVMRAYDARPIETSAARAAPRGCKPKGNVATVEIVATSDLLVDDVVWGDDGGDPGWFVVLDDDRSDATQVHAAVIIDDAGGIDEPTVLTGEHFMRLVGAPPAEGVEAKRREFYEAARTWFASTRANPMGVPWSVRERIDAERVMESAYDAMLAAEAAERAERGGKGE